MRGKLHWSVQLAMLLVFIAVIVASKVLWLAVFLVIVAAVLLAAWALWFSKRAVPSTPRPAIRRERQTPPPDDLSRLQALQPASSPHHPVDRNKLGMLRYTLHQADLDSNAVVFETGDRQTITVRDILVEMIEIAEAHGRPVEALARDIAAMYPRIFEHVKAALHQYRDDEELAKTYIARKAMTDIGWKLDE